MLNWRQAAGEEKSAFGSEESRGAFVEHLVPRVIAAQGLRYTRSDRQSARQAGCRETGGILIGRNEPDGWVAGVVEAAPKPKGSRVGWFWFQRSDTGLSALLEERWRDGLHYLDEWHFHPRGAPTPSGSDIRAMRKIATDDAYCCPSPILVILGGQPKADWSLSATLFRDGSAVALDRRRAR